MKNKTILPITFGCKLNQKDTEEWMYWFSEYGVQEQKVDPDIVLINTCVVTDHAEKEAIIAIKKWKATYPKACFIVTGCGVRKKNNMFTNMPEIQYCFPRFTIEAQQKLYDLIGTKEKVQGKKYVASKMIGLCMKNAKQLVMDLLWKENLVTNQKSIIHNVKCAERSERLMKKRLTRFILE